MITTFLTTPNASDGRSAFVAAANAFGDGLTPLSNEMNQTAADVNSDALAAAQSAGDADVARIAAEAARDAAQAAATASADTWVAGGTYAVNDLVWGDASSSRLYRALTAHSGVHTPPADDTINWVLTFADAAALAALQTTVTTLQAEVDSLRGVPSVSKSAAHTLELADRGKSIDTTAAVTIPAAATANFPVGSVVMITNKSNSDLAITPASGVTLRYAGFADVGARTLVQWGVCSLRKLDANVWIISGAGVR